ncbi:MAG: NADH-quinone oxidoreductase subunit M [Deltaproteobacteria bacterium]|nr:NADH-quinone oxidoreductase subunit M [Deltaproteobacteria bacterium]
MAYILTLLIFCPLAVGLTLLFFPAKAKRAMYGFSLVTSVAMFFLSLGLLTGDYSQGTFQFVTMRNWVPAFGITYSVGVDGITLWLVLLTTLLLPIVVLSSYSYIKDRIREYLFALFLLQTSMIGAFLALDLFLFFVFWELMLIPMYLIIGMWGGERRIHATVKFFIFTMVGSALMFVAILFLVAQFKELTGVTTFSYLELRRVILPPAMQWWLFLAFALSFAIKVPFWPLHTWLPDAHTEAPTGGSVILAAVLLKMGTYGFLRFAMPLFPQASHELGPTLAILAIIGIIFGSLVAWMQKDVKRLVAYSSVAHLGFCMLGLFALENRAMAGSVFQMLSHGISTGMLFLLVGVIYERRHTRLISEFGGLAKVMPAYAAVFVIVTLSSIGLPTTNGFIGEFLILWGTFKSQVLPHARWMATLAATGVILGAVYMLSVVLRMFFGSLKNPRNRDLKDLSAREWLYLLPGIILIFAMGLFPTPFLKKIEPSVELMRMDYLRKGAASLTIDQPVLSKPVTWLLPPDRRPLPIAAKPRQIKAGPGQSITKLTANHPLRKGGKIKGYRPGSPLPTGHKPNLPKVPPVMPGGGKPAKGGVQ